MQEEKNEETKNLKKKCFRMWHQGSIFVFSIFNIITILYISCYVLFYFCRRNGTVLLHFFVNVLSCSYFTCLFENILKCIKNLQTKTKKKWNTFFISCVFFLGVFFLRYFRLSAFILCIIKLLISYEKLLSVACWNGHYCLKYTT